MARIAGPADVDAIVDTMTGAFLNDPLWGPAFPHSAARAQQTSAFWRLFVSSALRYPWTLVTEHVEAAAVWIPPGGTELSDKEERAFEPFLIDIAGPSVAAGILTICQELAAARPRQPHFYLSLLATHPEHRGAGLGTALLQENLERIDALGACAYLESSNPANNSRYHRAGFTSRRDIRTASGQVVTTMWRPATSQGT